MLRRFMCARSDSSRRSLSCSSSARLRSEISRTKHQSRRPPCSNWFRRTSTGKEVPSLRRWRVSKVMASPATMRCFRRWMDVTVETDIEIAFMFADQFFPAVAQTMAGLAVDVENGPIIVKQKEGIGRVIHEDTEAPLACAQLLLRLSQLRDVLQDAKLAQRASRFVPRHVALTVDYSQSAVGTDHPVFDIIAWTPGQQGSRSRLAYSRPVLGVNQA